MKFLMNHTLASTLHFPMLTRITCTILAVLFCTHGTLSGQNLPGTANPRKQLARPAQQKKTPAQEKVTIPDAVNVVVETKDGFTLNCSWLAAPFDEKADDSSGKSVVPYLILHDWESSRRQTFAFGRFVQSRGNAVLIPDLRGHGTSTTVAGQKKPVTFDRLGKAQRVNITQDIEACKRFLIQKNNAGDINVDLLVVVAVGKMVPPAVQWSLNDWTAFPARSPSTGVKQGQDVKGLVLVSPKKKFGTFSLSQTLRHTMFTGNSGNEMPIMMVWATEDKACAKDAKSMFNTLEKGRPDISELPRNEQAVAKTLFSAKIDRSSLDANGLIANPNGVKGLWQYIESKMTEKVKQDIDRRQWEDRSRKKR